MLFKIASCNNRKSISACKKQHFRKRFLIARFIITKRPPVEATICYLPIHTYTYAHTHEMPYNRVWQISLYVRTCCTDEWCTYLHAFGFKRPEGGWTCRRRRIHARCVDIRVAYVNSRGRVWSCVKIGGERARGGPAGYARLGVRSVGPSQGLQTSSAGGLCANLWASLQRRTKRWSWAQWTSRQCYMRISCAIPRVPKISNITRSTFNGF